MPSEAAILHARWAKAIGMDLPEMQDADVVICIMPDRTEHFAKGEGHKSLLNRRGEARDLIVMRVPILSLDMLTALQKVLGAQQ